MIDGAVAPPRADRRATLAPAEGLLERALPADAHAALDTLHHRRQTELRHLAANADRLRYSVVDLASIDLPPARLIDALSPDFDRPIVGEHLEQALACLKRIVEEWRRRADAPPARG